MIKVLRSLLLVVLTVTAGVALATPVLNFSAAINEVSEPYILVMFCTGFAFLLWARSKTS